MGWGRDANGVKWIQRARAANAWKAVVVTKATRTEVNTIISVYLGVPFPAAVVEAVGCVLEHDLISLLDVDLVGVDEVAMKKNRWRRRKHTVLSVIFCRSVGIVSGSMGDSMSSDRSSTAFSRSLNSTQHQYDPRYAERKNKGTHL